VLCLHFPSPPPHQGVGGAWGGRPELLPPAPRFMDVEEFVCEASACGATVILALHDSLTATGELQQLLEGAGVGFTGVNADYALTSCNRIALHKVLGAMPRGAGYPGGGWVGVVGVCVGGGCRGVCGTWGRGGRLRSAGARAGQGRQHGGCAVCLWRSWSISLEAVFVRVDHTSLPRYLASPYFTEGWPQGLAGSSWMARHVVLLLTAVMVCLDNLVGRMHNDRITQGVGLSDVDPCCAVLCSLLSLLPSAAHT
jgi:hypothetical protein